MKWEGSLCQQCGGTCCKVGFSVHVLPDEPLYTDDRYVRIDKADPKDSEFRKMKTKEDQLICIALGDDNKCTVWDKRPRECRNFEVDSETCKAVRRLCRKDV